ncbi:MAG: phosphatase PAP2 family protein [Nitrospirae bacterium]|nr:MAG: phosphatase PAP2 family protein [Nitrospirota bacterium]
MTGDGSIQTGGSSRVTRYASRVTAVLFSCAALAGVFWGLLQVDLPLARFLRSVHHAGLEQAGDLGNRLGSGWGLVIISGTMLAIGFLLKRQTVQRAGMDGLIAHGVAALVTQLLKHLIGRPRPRLMHNGSFQFGPSLETGLDSFPSGHTTASFAVAVVVAKQFPRIGWLVYGMACLVAASRIVRGSHFPTDVAAGVVLGILAGSLVADPIREWRKSLAEGLVDLIPYLAGAFALLWIALHPYPNERTILMMGAIGWVVIGLGLFIRLSLKIRPRSWSGGMPAANALLGIGLAITTGSLLVTVLALLIVGAWWLELRDGAYLDAGGSAAVNVRFVMTESAVAMSVAAAAVAIQAVKGLLPIL